MANLSSVKQFAVRGFVLWGLMALASAAQAQMSPLYRPTTALQASELAIIVNDMDTQSREVAAYYQKQRQIPDSNVIHVHFAPKQAVMSRNQFEHLKQEVEQKTPKQVQAYALTWTLPYRVDCMSITTAFAAGFDPEYCVEGCKMTKGSTVFASEHAKPFTDHGIRPTMMLAGSHFDDVKRLIDLGVAADFTNPKGEGFLLKTSDTARSSRAVTFPNIASKFADFWPVQYLEQDFVSGHDHVMFYFTGLKRVPHITENHYLPGAVADHLTSVGGVTTEKSSQMNVLEWLKAGVTGSYGTVVEPCNFPAKFSNPGVLMYFYLRGSTLIEAYWKSVEQPGQGLFVGEPLARPFAFKAK